MLIFFVNPTFIPDVKKKKKKLHGEISLLSTIGLDPQSVKSCCNIKATD